MSLAFLRASRALWRRRVRYRKARLAQARAAKDVAREHKWAKLVRAAEDRYHHRNRQIAAEHPGMSWRALRTVQPRLTVDQAKTLAHALSPAFRKYEITTPARAAAAVAQFAHESAGFSTTTEFASGAEYEGRGDLGNTHTGDGVRFKGRGYIQITGRNNYANVSKAFDVDFLAHPELLAQPKYAAMASCWWWKAHGCNEFADRGDFEGLTRRINGGLNGYSSRQEYWARAKRVAGKLTPR